MWRRPSSALALLVIPLAIGCNLDKEQRHPDRPGPGGGPGGNEPDQPPDAGGPDLDGGAALITGSLCRLVDLRFFEQCTPTDLSLIDIGVRGSSATTVTDAAGTFAIADPGGDLILEIGFDTPDIRDAVIELSRPIAGPVQVPVVLQADWDVLVDALQAVEPGGTGTLAVYARDGGVPVSGVEVVPPGGSLEAFYDAGSALEWSQLGLTGIGGAALIFSVNDIGRADVSLIDPLGPVIDLSPPVSEDALTFAVAEL